MLWSMHLLLWLLTLRPTAVPRFGGYYIGSIQYQTYRIKCRVGPCISRQWCMLASIRRFSSPSMKSVDQPSDLLSPSSDTSRSHIHYNPPTPTSKNGQSPQRLHRPSLHPHRRRRCLWPCVSPLAPLTLPPPGTTH